MSSNAQNIPTEFPPISVDHRTPVRSDDSRRKASAATLVRPLNGTSTSVPKVGLSDICLSYKTEKGERLLAWSQTEPAGGGNAAYHQTRITAEGNAYRLNGLKLFCTQGKADTILVGPGERYSVLVHATDLGTWAWHCHILTHAESETGMFGMVTAMVVTA